MSLNEQQFVGCDTWDSVCNDGPNVQRFLRLPTWHPHTAACAEKLVARAYGRVAQCVFLMVALLEHRQRSVSENGFKGEATDSEQALMPALSQRPVSTAIEADPFSFVMCKTGVLTAKYGTKFDRRVVTSDEQGLDLHRVPQP